MIRKILSVIAGLITANVVFLIVEAINHSLYPFPKNLDFKDTLAVQSFYESQPITIWFLVLIGWFVGSFLGGFVIKLISKNENKTLPIIAGVVLTLSAIANFYLIPHPTWFIVVGLLVFIPSVLIGHKFYKINHNGQ